MPGKATLPDRYGQPLHLVIIASDDVRTLIQDEFSGWVRPRFWFTSFTDSRLAMRYVKEAECPVIDLAIVELNLAGRAGVDRLLETLRSRFPDCPTIVSVEAPVEMAELVAVTTELSRTGKGALSQPHVYAALRMRAMQLLKDALLRLRTERSSVEHAIHTLVTRQAFGELHSGLGNRRRCRHANKTR